MALPSAELPRTAGPVYLHPVAAPLEGVSARRTFGTLISAGRNRISLLRLGASGDFAVCCRAWRLPAAHKKHWSGLPTASSAARPGVGLLSAGGGEVTRPSPLSPTPGRPSPAPSRSSQRRASCPPRTSPRASPAGGGCTSRRASTRPARPRARASASWGAMTWAR